MGIIGKLISKLKSSLYVFKKAEILKNIVNKEIDGEYDNLCHQCFFNERYHERAKLEGIFEIDKKLKISIYLGGALGDYIVYLKFVDEISSICDCTVDLFIDKIIFADYIYGKRENVNIIHDAHNNLFNNSTDKYDLAVHLDHGLTLRNCNLGSIREKAPDFYVSACKIVEYYKSNRIDINNQSEREIVILKKAEFFGDNKWSKLSCGVADMGNMYSNILLSPNDSFVLDRYNLKDKRYITVNFGADKNMGGTAQTKVLPFETLAGFVQRFKSECPEILVVQTGLKDSTKIPNVDCYAFDCVLGETAFILKDSMCHIDSEGGLVHMSAQMSTTCVVSFGPTPEYYYGYKRNRNIVSTVCNNCMATTPQWSRLCPRGMQTPECMKSITVDMIFEQVRDVITQQSEKQINQIDNNKDIGFTSNLFEAKRNVCIISDLDLYMYEFVKKLKTTDKNITLFIPTELDEDIINYRTELKKENIKVEYGNALNIARMDNSFDVVICKVSQMVEQNKERCEKECKRLVNELGNIIWLNR